MALFSVGASTRPPVRPQYLPPRSCCWLSWSQKLETQAGHTMPLLIHVYRKQDHYLQEQKH